MIWYFIMCTHVYMGGVCTSPVPMPSERACHFMGQQAAIPAESSAYRYRCIGVNAK